MVQRHALQLAQTVLGIQDSSQTKFSQNYKEKRWEKEFILYNFPCEIGWLMIYLGCLS